MLKYILLIAMILSTVACTKKKEAGQTASPKVDWAANASIYEVNIRQYTPEGTFNAFAEHLPRLKELGVGILWLMPVTPISEKGRKGTLGSYYAVKNYREVNPEYGTMDDFKALVRQAHELGFKVILDWVANHTGWDNPLIEEHPDWYTQKDGRIVSPVDDWSDVADLNYDNREMRRYMTESMHFWIEEADVDGFRCDMAAMVPTDFWEETRVSLDSLKPVFMLAEAWEPELTRQAFDACYGWDLHHLMNDIAQGKKNAGELPAYFSRLDTLYPAHTLVMNFIDNHDENSWAGSVPERMGDAAPAFAVLTYTVPGLPLLYSGQEAGLDKRLPFFEKDSIDWGKNPGLAAFYRSLNELKHNNPALAGGQNKGSFRILPHDNPRDLFAYERTSGNNRVIVILNLANEARTFRPETVTEGNFTDHFTGESCAFIGEQTLGAFGVKVFVQK